MLQTMLLQFAAVVFVVDVAVFCCSMLLQLAVAALAVAGVTVYREPTQRVCADKRLDFLLVLYEGDPKIIELADDS